MRWKVKSANANILHLTNSNATHPRTDGINNVSAASFMVLASIRDQYRHFRVLVEYLLNATIVNALLATGGLRLANLKIIVVLIFSICQARYIVWRLGRHWRRGRGDIAIVWSFKIARTSLEERYDVIGPHGRGKQK